jgi:16S rRNA (cytosine967-C5)-methyltransferase
MNQRRKRSPRLVAVNMLSNVLDKHQNLNDADETNALSDSRDRALARHLLYGILRWLNSLQWLSGNLLDRPLKNRDQDVNRLILLGLYQLWQDETAPHAAIHETAECARALGKPWAVGLVNAVLRRFQREQKQLLDSLQQEPERHAHPQWLLAKLQSDWPQDWPKMVAANNQAAPLWLRINRRKADHRGVPEALAQAGFDVADHPFAADAIRITPAAGVKSIPGFEEGRLSVQDPAAQLAVDLLDVQSQQRVLDACAAPGGKTCHILERFPGIEMTAVELNKNRRHMIQENLDRLGLSGQAGLRLVTADAADTADWWDGALFDRILLDAPCTATGVIRRHPEIKWLRTVDQLQEVTLIQHRLLERLWPLLETGGILVYATCSVLIEENQNQIRHFLARHDDAEELAVDLPPGLSLDRSQDRGRNQDPGRQILPGEEEMDGFFYARLRKIA